MEKRVIESHMNEEEIKKVLENDIDEILPGLFVSAITPVKTLAKLQSLAVTHILSLTTEHEPYFPEHFRYLVIPIDDLPLTIIRPYFESAFDFINSAIGDTPEVENGKVVVHCQGGRSRSGSFLSVALLSIA